MSSAIRDRIELRMYAYFDLSNDRNSFCNMKQIDSISYVYSHQFFVSAFSHLRFRIFECSFARSDPDLYPDPDFPLSSFAPGFSPSTSKYLGDCSAEGADFADLESLLLSRWRRRQDDHVTHDRRVAPEMQLKTASTPEVINVRWQRRRIFTMRDDNDAESLHR